MMDEPEKPCIALMGEFSAGKSTLANLLIGCDPLPVQVIATQLPPVRISYGQSAPYRVDLEGRKVPIELSNLADIPFESTAYLHIFCIEDILLQCDLLDMPGISDPNMSSEVWERMIDKADAVLWCSHATQAWRQSEAAVWASMPETLQAKSLLLLTRIDKLTTATDRNRVIQRVKHETAGLFRNVLPISLLLATKEQDDFELWSQSGAADFAAELVALLGDLNAERDVDQPHANLTLPGLTAPEQSPTLQTEANSPKVVPRRL